MGPNPKPSVKGITSSNEVIDINNGDKIPLLFTREYVPPSTEPVAEVILIPSEQLELRDESKFLLKTPIEVLHHDDDHLDDISYAGSIEVRRKQSNFQVQLALLHSSRKWPTNHKVFATDPRLLRKKPIEVFANSEAHLTEISYSGSTVVRRKPGFDGDRRDPPHKTSLPRPVTELLKLDIKDWTNEERQFSKAKHVEVWHYKENHLTDISYAGTTLVRRLPGERELINEYFPIDPRRNRNVMTLRRFDIQKWNNSQNQEKIVSSENISEDDEQFKIGLLESSSLDSTYSKPRTGFWCRIPLSQIDHTTLLNLKKDKKPN